MNDSRQPTKTRKFKLSGRLLVIPPILVGISVIAALVLNKKELDRVDAGETANPVRVIEVKHQPIAATATGYGTVRAKRVWVAVAEVGGRVNQIHDPLRSGIFVNKDSLLVKIDPTDYELMQKQRDAELQQARAELRQLEINERADRESLKIQKELLVVRKQDVDRLKRLSGSAAASVSELDAALAMFLTQTQAVQNLESGLALYESRKLAGEAQIASAESRLVEVNRDLDRTQIRAPIDGVLSEVDLEVGQYVSPQQTLFQVLEVSRVEVEAQFSLAQLMRLMAPTGMSADVGVLGREESGSQLSKHYSVRVVVHSGNSALGYQAIPIRVADQVDPKTRTLGVVVEVTNPGFAAGGTSTSPASVPLRPGTFCEVVVERKDRVSGVLLERTAVDRDVVYVVDSDNRIRRRNVQARAITGSKIAITGGLRDGERVVLNPPAVPTDGLLISPIMVQPTDTGEEAIALTNDPSGVAASRGQETER